MPHSPRIVWRARSVINAESPVPPCRAGPRGCRAHGGTPWRCALRRPRRRDHRQPAGLAASGGRARRGVRRHGEQLAGPIQRVAGSAAVAEDGVLDPAAGAVDHPRADSHDVERVGDLSGTRQLGVERSPEPLVQVKHRHPDRRAPSGLLSGEPASEITGVAALQVCQATPSSEATCDTGRGRRRGSVHKCAAGQIGNCSGHGSSAI